MFLTFGSQIIKDGSFHLQSSQTIYAGRCSKELDEDYLQPYYYLLVCFLGNFF